MSNSGFRALAAVAASVMVIGAVGVFWFGAQRPVGVGVMPAPDGVEGLQVHAEQSADDALPAGIAKQNEVIARLTKRLEQLERESRSAPAGVIAGPTPQRGPLVEAGLIGDTPAPMTTDQVENLIRVHEDEAVARDRERVADIDGNWASEPIDQDWAVHYEDDVREALDSLRSVGSDSVSLTDVNCRATVCKLVLNGASAVDAGDLSMSLITLESFQNTEFTITKPEGGDPGQVVIYLARPGAAGLSRLAAGR